MAKLTAARRAKIASNLVPRINLFYIVRMLLARVWPNRESEISRPIFFDLGRKK